MRAVVLDDARLPRLAEVPEPMGEGTLVRVLACGLCGSDVEKIGVAEPGTVLGHEVVAELDNGLRGVLVHHLPCGHCERCAAGHESTCEQFPRSTIVPGGFADLARAAEILELPDDVSDALGTYAEPLACVLRGLERVPRGRVAVVGQGFIGKLFATVLEQRGDTVFRLDADPARDGEHPDGPVDAAVVCAPGGGAAAASHLTPGGTLLVFADGGDLPLDLVYRRELHVAGSRSATPQHLRAAIALLPTLDLPEATVLSLDRFDEGLALFRAREAAKVVFTP
jgi:L-iditol 2-dehydrogenase